MAGWLKGSSEVLPRLSSRCDASAGKASCRAPRGDPHESPALSQLAVAPRCHLASRGGPCVARASARYRSRSTTRSRAGRARGLVARVQARRKGQADEPKTRRRLRSSREHFEQVVLSWHR